MERATTSNDASSTSSASQAVPVLPVEPQSSDAPAIWRAGTLTYTPRSLRSLFVWLLGGDFAWQLRERAIAPAMPLLLRNFGGNDFLAGLLLGTIPPAMGIILSPVIGYRSDRLRSRLGRRIPFLLLSTPVAVLAMFGLAASPMFGHSIHRALGPAAPSSVFCVLGIFAVFWTLFEVAAVVCNALHGALVNDVVPRPVLGRFFGLFRVVSLGAGILFNYYFLKHVANHYVLMFVTIGLLYGVVFSLMCLKVKEGQYPPPPPAQRGRWIDRLFGAFETYFRECFTIPLYLWFFLSFFLAYIAFAPINLFSLYYGQSVGMTMATYGKFSALQLFCSMVQAPILGWLCDKFHPLRMTMFALAMYAITTMAAFFLARDWKWFAAAHVICGTCSGIWLTTTSPLAQVILPKMKFATFASALAIFCAAGTMVAGPTVGRFLDLLNRHMPPGSRDYHSIYLWASFFITLSLLSTLVVYRQVNRHGGLRDYQAPEPPDILSQQTV